MSSPQEMMRDSALAEVGYTPSSDKLNRYAEYLDMVDIYNELKNGSDWCDVFADCEYVFNFELDVAVRMIAQPLRGCGAGCAFSASYYRAADQWDRDPSRRCAACRLGSTTAASLAAGSTAFWAS